MPRKNPLPTEDLETGLRVRVIRERRGQSRAAFAADLGSDSSTITAVEHGRSPLRFDLADQICNRLGVTYRWLATGHLPMHYRIHFYGSALPIPPRTPFRRVYFEHLSERSDKLLKEAARRARCSVEELDSIAVVVSSLPGADAAEESALIRERLVLRVEQFLRYLPSELYRSYSEKLSAATEAFLRENAQKIRKIKTPVEPQKHKGSRRSKK